MISHLILHNRAASMPTDLIILWWQVRFKGIKQNGVMCVQSIGLYAMLSERSSLTTIYYSAELVKPWYI